MILCNIFSKLSLDLQPFNRTHRNELYSRKSFMKSTMTGKTMIRMWWIAKMAMARVVAMAIIISPVRPMKFIQKMD